MDLFYNSSAQYGSHEPHVATELLKRGQLDQRTEFYIAFNFN